MANPALDQFSQALFWKLVPIMILSGVGGLLLREGLQWMERRAIRFGRERRERMAKHKLNIGKEEVVHCPTCNALMVLRIARRGLNAGAKFWGCSTYPMCKGTRKP